MAIPTINTIKHQNLMKRLRKKQEQFEEALELIKGEDKKFDTFELSPTRRFRASTPTFGVHYNHLFIDDFIMLHPEETKILIPDIHKWRR